MDLPLKILDVTTDFWQKLSVNMSEDIQNAPSAMQQILEEEYPKLLKSYCDMIRKLNYEKFNLE